MAIAKGPLSQVKGRLKNTTSYMLEGQMVVRAIPAYVRQPETDKQLQSRCRLMLSARLAKMFGTPLKRGFARRDVGMSVRAQFSKINSKILGHSTYTPGQVPWQSLSLSRGELAVAYLRVAFSRKFGAMGIEVLPQPTNAFTQPDDKIWVCVVQPSVLEADCPDKSEEETWAEFNKRFQSNSFGSIPLKGCTMPRIAEQVVTIQGIIAKAGETLWVYYFAYNERTKEASVTQVVRLVVE